MKQTNELFEEMASRRNDVKRVSGDGLSVRLESNDQVLEVTGDGCRITVAKNRGSVRVVGDGCKVRIAYNAGDVEYNGDGGHVLLGPRSSKENVRYIGDGGKVSFDLDAETLMKNQRNTVTVRQKTEIPCGKSSKEKLEGVDKTGANCRMNSLRNQDKDFSNITVEMENILNERREMRVNEEKRDGRKKDKKQPDKSASRKTKIVTVVEYDGQEFARKWFVDSGNALESFQGCTVTILPKRSKTVTRVQ